MKRRALKSYNAIVGLGFTLLSLTVYLNLLFMYRAHDLLPLSFILESQQHEAALYNSPFHSIYQYKLDLHRIRRADVITVGSSRTFQFRQDPFKVKFTNAGGVAPSIAHARRMIERLVDVHVPKVILLGVDYWWFAYYPEALNDAALFPDTRDLLAPLRLTQKPGGEQGVVLDIQTIMDVVVSGAGGVDGPELPVSLYGAGAVIKRYGFGPDGSFYYVDRYFGDKPAPEYAVRFGYVTNALRLRGGGRFPGNAVLKDEALAAFDDILHFAAKHDVTVIPFLTPLPGSVMRKVERQPNLLLYIEEVKRELSKRSGQFADFLDASSFNSSDCEFIDGFHGGEITYLRILQKLAEKPGSALKDLVDEHMIQSRIEQYAGRTFVPAGPVGSAFVGRKEVDYLDLGCSKS